MDMQLVRLSATCPLSQRALDALPTERRQSIANRLHVEDRKRSLVGELLARRAVSRRLQIPLDQVVIRYTRYGKPYVKDIPCFHFSISHAGDYVAYADSSREIGIDIEPLKPIDLRIAFRFFTEKEYRYICSQQDADRLTAFYTLWTLKESYVKAEGKGLAIPLSSFAFHIGARIYLTAGQNRRRYRFLTRSLDDGENDTAYMLSLCHQEKNDLMQLSVCEEEELYDCLGYR